MRNLCLVNVQLTFPKENPNLATFDFWWILSFLGLLWSNLDQMMNVSSKCWYQPKILEFECMLTIIDFLPNTIDFQSSEQLKPGISILWRIRGAMKTTWDLGNPILLDKYKTLILTILSLWWFECFSLKNYDQPFVNW